MIRYILSLLSVNWNLEAWKSATSWAGWIILLIVEIPILLLILAAILGRPRKLKVAVIFITIIIVLFAGFIAATWILGSITSFYVS